jgi:hypothetical protein
MKTSFDQSPKQAQRTLVHDYFGILASWSERNGYLWRRKYGIPIFDPLNHRNTSHRGAPWYCACSTLSVCMLCGPVLSSGWTCLSVHQIADRGVTNLNSRQRQIGRRPRDTSSFPAPSPTHLKSYTHIPAFSEACICAELVPSHRTSNGSRFP